MARRKTGWKPLHGMTFRWQNRHKALTDRQRLVLEYILYFVDRWGVQPTRTQIAHHMDIGPSTVMGYLWRLYEKGYIGRPEPGYVGVKLFRRPDNTPFWRDLLPAPSSEDRSMILLLRRGRKRLANYSGRIQVGLLNTPNNAPRCNAPVPWGAMFMGLGMNSSRSRLFLDRLSRRRNQPLFSCPPTHVHSPDGLRRWLDRWEPEYARLGLKLGLPLDVPTQRIDPESLPWGRFAWLCLVGDQAWSFSTGAARFAAAAADRKVPLFMMGADAEAARRLHTAVRFGAAAISGLGWSRLTPNDPPFQRLEWLLKQRTFYDPIPPDLTRSADESTPTPKPRRARKNTGVV